MSAFPKISASSNNPVLIAVAAPLELQAVLRGLGAQDQPIPDLWQTLRPRSDIVLLHCGVSKSNAAGSIARALTQTANVSCVLNFGIAGALPSTPRQTLQPGDALVATASVFADEGLVTASGYQSVAAIGFPLEPTGTGSFPGDPGLRAVFREHVDSEGPVACVSTCSGTDALAREVAQRTGAHAECMEGAAIALVCARLHIPFCEVRTISNYTGERAAQQWDIGAALERLSELVRAVFAPKDR